MAKTLITGHKGFIGSVLSKEVGDFIGIDTKDNENVLYDELPDDIDTIYHLAAHSSVEYSFINPVLDSMNYCMTVRLAHRYPNAKIIFTQSAASLDITSPYGLSKWVSGEYLNKFHKNSVICVLPNLYGEGGKGVVELFKGKKEVVVYGDGKQVRDFVHVDDIVRGLVQAKDWEIGTYFMGSEKGTTINELAQGKTITRLPARKEIRESILPNTTPNWKPKIKVTDYVKDM